MDDKLNIRVWIGNLLFPLTILRKDEEHYRNAAKQVTNILNKYRQDYPERKMEEIWAMAAFEISFQNILMKDRNDTQPFNEKIKELDKDIDQLIRDEQ